MAQLNLNLTPDFERDLDALMRARGYRHKSEAVRAAVHETAERASSPVSSARFESWIGMARAGEPNPTPRFRDDDDLWGDR